MKKLAFVFGTIIVFIVSASIICSGEENIIKGCYQKKNGQLRIVSDRSKCKKSEIPISWNLKGPQGPKGDTGPMGPQGIPGGVQVFDANGQYLGISLGGYYPSVFVPALSRSVRINTETGEITPASLSFATDDCTGTPYLSGAASYEAYQFSLGSHKIYTGEGMIPETRYVYSYFNINGSCVTQKNGPWPLVKAIEMTLPFSIPVALPLEFRY